MSETIPAAALPARWRETAIHYELRAVEIGDKNPRAATHLKSAADERRSCANELDASLHAQAEPLATTAGSSKLNTETLNALCFNAERDIMRCMKHREGEDIGYCGTCGWAMPLFRVIRALQGVVLLRKLEEPAPAPTGDRALPSVAGRLDTSYSHFEHRCLVQIAELQRRPCFDTALLALLCDAVRVVREVGEALPALPGAAHPANCVCADCMYDPPSGGSGPRPTPTRSPVQPGAAETPQADNGNLFIFCDHVDRACGGCIRGAGHNGPHVFAQRNITIQAPVVLAKGPETPAAPSAPTWKCSGCAHLPHGPVCLAGEGPVCRCDGQPKNDVVCQHGQAADVHCCHCHSGFIFDIKHECPPQEGTDR